MIAWLILCPSVILALALCAALAIGQIRGRK